MTRILYCVFPCSDRQVLPALRGIDARPVELVARGGLCAATSAVDEVPVAPTLERIQAFERVVETVFEERTVVPMRFGSTLESEPQVAGYLKEQAPTFRAQLRKLGNSVEMGVRLLVPASTISREPRAARRFRPRAARATGPGHAYLAARARRLPDDGGPLTGLGGFVERCKSAFQGLFTELKVDAPSLLVHVGEKVELKAADSILQTSDSRRGALSLSFLVPRARVEAFRRAFGRTGWEPAAVRLSGPWPPYSFASG